MRTRETPYFLTGADDPTALNLPRQELSLSLMPLTITTEVYTAPEHEYFSSETDYFSKQNKFFVCGLAVYLDLPVNQVEVHIFPVSFVFPDLDIPMTQVEVHLFPITIMRLGFDSAYLEMEF